MQISQQNSGRGIWVRFPRTIESERCHANSNSNSGVIEQLESDRSDQCRYGNVDQLISNINGDEQFSWLFEEKADELSTPASCFLQGGQLGLVQGKECGFARCKKSRKPQKDNEQNGPG